MSTAEGNGSDTADGAIPLHDTPKFANLDHLMQTVIHLSEQVKNLNEQMVKHHTTHKEDLIKYKDANAEKDRQILHMSEIIRNLTQRIYDCEARILYHNPVSQPNNWVQAQTLHAHGSATYRAPTETTMTVSTPLSGPPSEPKMGPTSGAVGKKEVGGNRGD